MNIFVKISRKFRKANMAFLLWIWTFSAYTIQRMSHLCYFYKKKKKMRVNTPNHVNLVFIKCSNSASHEGAFVIDDVYNSQDN